MTFHTHLILPVPDVNADATLSAFPTGNRSVTLGEELGTLFTDALFASWFTLSSVVFLCKGRFCGIRTPKK